MKKIFIFIFFIHLIYLIYIAFNYYFGYIHIHPDFEFYYNLLGSIGLFLTAFLIFKNSGKMLEMVYLKERYEKYLLFAFMLFIAFFYLKIMPITFLLHTQSNFSKSQSYSCIRKVESSNFKRRTGRGNFHSYYQLKVYDFYDLSRSYRNIAIYSKKQNPFLDKHEGMYLKLDFEKYRFGAVKLVNLDIIEEITPLIEANAAKKCL